MKWIRSSASRRVQCVLAGVPVLLLMGCSPGAPSGGAPRGNGRPAPEYAEEAHGPLRVTPPVVAGDADLFEDVSARAGIDFVQQFCDTRIANILESNGSGAAVLDYDGDGWMDVYLVNAGPLEGVTRHAPGTKREPNRLYRNRGDGTFEDVTLRAGVAGRGFGAAAVAGDYDGDGWVDLYLANVGTNLLYRNRGDGTFAEVAEAAGVADGGTGIGAVFADYDRDGDLDLLVANYLTFDPDYRLYFNPDAYPGPLSYKSEFNVLYRNEGDGTFVDVSEAAGIRVAGHRGMSVCALDCDGDGDTDFYVCNDATPNILLVNDGQGRFTEEAQDRRVALNALGETAGSMTAAVGDYNGDLIPDILVSRLGYGSLYTGSPQGVFEDRMMDSRLGSFTAQYVGWGSNFLDYDNDGDLDAFVANGDAHHLVGWESLLLENLGDQTFADAVDQGGVIFRTKIRARGSVVLDFDNDGWLDVLVTTMGDRPFLLRNRGVPSRHWLTLELEATQGHLSGYGSRITLTSGGRRQLREVQCPAGFLSSSDPRVHFGLGEAQTVDRLEIRWPSGTVQTLEGIPADQFLKVKEP